MLTIKRASAAVVGRYYCVKRSMYDEENEDELDELVVADHASTVYVYVNDTEQPLVPVNVPAFRVNQYDTLVIPCKPSHPATEVELHKDVDGVSMINELVWCGTNSSGLIRSIDSRKTCIGFLPCLGHSIKNVFLLSSILSF